NYRGGSAAVGQMGTIRSRYDHRKSASMQGAAALRPPRRSARMYSSAAARAALTVRARPLFLASQPTLQLCRAAGQNRRTFIGRTTAMDEYVRRMYLKEEEFLEEYLGTVEAAVDLLHLDWQPNYSCNDQVREGDARRLRAGALHTLNLRGRGPLQRHQ